ncbi:protein PLANT CADMIUM RESISTANCE 9-like [Herrania umbratica]|uniref:Protein PLANT CADMIUM RESISTANCE 9-like n=1 Tax=Herrania umbratica TaxID=108875 RepID=A0A6J1BL92_9ROSI|nr:protein PLANT CADMIUM RESISTANCE 9-like [Herrania umbratica]
MHPKNPEAASPKSAPHQEQYPEGQWTTGLYDCCDDPSNCLTTCFCPCITFGRIAEIIDRGDRSRGLSCLVYYAMNSIHCAWLYGGLYRTKLRQVFSLPETPCGDNLVHCCCCLCSLSQEYRELKNRGVDPSIGWQANVEKWKRGGLKPPISPPGMNR